MKKARLAGIRDGKEMKMKVNVTESEMKIIFALFFYNFFLTLKGYCSMARNDKVK